METIVYQSVSGDRMSYCGEYLLCKVGKIVVSINMCGRESLDVETLLKVKKLVKECCVPDEDFRSSIAKAVTGNMQPNRGDLPTLIFADGSQEWRVNGVLHRDGDQPALIFADGGREWYMNGKLHRRATSPR